MAGLKLKFYLDQSKQNWS